MKVKLLYFGRPAENLKVRQELADIPNDTATLSDLLTGLRLRGEIWQHELSEGRIRCAINQEFSPLTAHLQEQDEVAIFSPISGG